MKKNSDCKSEPISYEGKRLSEYEKKEDFKQARYIIITGNDSISKNNDQEIYNSTLKDNKHGEKIKVILEDINIFKARQFIAFNNANYLHPPRKINSIYLARKNYIVKKTISRFFTLMIRFIVRQI